MTITHEIELPTDDELTVPELNLSGAALRAGAFQMGKYCENQSNEFSLCRAELNDPRKCLEEGKILTNCALKFFSMVKKTCSEEFTQYANCLDKSSGDFQFACCRNTQNVYDKCVFDNLGIERPEYGYFARAKVHKTDRPPLPTKPKTVYEDATPYLPEDYPRPTAKYGSRFLWMD